MLGAFGPLRLWKALRFLLTVFLLVKRRESFLGFPPLAPDELRRCVLKLGVSFIKLAQVLATRQDFFGPEYVAALRTIHDEVAPMPPAEFAAAMALAFPEGRPFAAFDDAPLASASIGQVHRAVLDDGAMVAVKLRRLRIEELVAADLRILNVALWLFTPLFSRATRNSLEAVLREFAAMIRRECDMSVELANLRAFRETFRMEGVRLPVPYPALSNRHALVMSFEEGFRIDDRAALADSGLDFRPVMERLIVFYTEQMLIKGLFNADPHPGNILVRADGDIVLLDYGMVKRLRAETRVAMIEVVKAANDRDFDLYTAACKRLGVVTADAPEEEVREFAERMFAIFGNEALTARTMQNLAFEVLASMRSLPFKLPQDVVYVMRASSLVEGLGTIYIDNFNGIKDVLPVLRDNLRRALGAEAGLFPTLIGEARSLPLTLRRAKQVLTDLSESQLRVRLSDETVERLADEAFARLRPVALGALAVLAAFLVPLLGLPHAVPLSSALFLFGVWRILAGFR